jgi:hypothetical protein
MLIDLVAVGLLVAEEAVMHVFSRNSEAALDFISDNILVIRLASVIIVGCVRAFAEHRVLKKRSLWWTGAVEWIAIVIAAFLAVCWLDILWNPRDNFKTVFGFNLLLVLVPSVVLSTVAYVLTWWTAAAWKRNDRA